MCSHCWKAVDDYITLTKPHEDPRLMWLTYICTACVDQVEADNRRVECRRCGYRDLTVKVLEHLSQHSQKTSDGDLVTDCCKADFDPWGYPREDGLWDEKCLKCGGRTDVNWYTNEQIKQRDNQSYQPDKKVLGKSDDLETDELTAKKRGI